MSQVQSIHAAVTFPGDEYIRRKAKELIKKVSTDVRKEYLLNKIESLRKELSELENLGNQ